jgi:hypothetical protein
MLNYAQLDENNICIGVSQLTGKVTLDNMILIAECNASLLGMTYNSGVWEEAPEPDPKPQPQEPQLTEGEQTQLEIALNIEYLICLAELSD